MPTSSINLWIEKYLARVRFGQFLRRAAEWSAGFLFIFGTVVLVAKLFIPQAWPHVLWGGLGLLPCLAFAWWLSQREQETSSESIARLDTALNSGGLLMTLCERPDVDWSSRLPQVEQLWREALPRIHARRFTGYIVLPLAFAVGACFIPLRDATTAPILRNSVAQKAAKDLEELLAVLDEEKVFDKEEEEQLKKEIEMLAEETRSTPLTHEKWETVDALRERMRVRLDGAAMTTAQAAAAAALLAAAAGLEGPELSLERTEQLEKDLGEMLQKMGQKGAFSNATKGLQNDLQRLLKNGKLQLPQDGEERERLLNELREHIQSESNKLCELRDKCSLCEGDRFNEGNVPCQSLSSGNIPGRGGVTRGRGDAELTWGDESDKVGTKFKEVVLPPGFLDQPKDEIVSVQKTAPNEETAANAPRSAQRLLDPAAGSATWNRKVSPRHRDVVRKYFDDKGN